MERTPKEDKFLPEKPHLKYIEKTLALLESEKGPDGEEINWKNLYEKVGSWETGLELSDKIRKIVRDYVLSKFPVIKEKIPTLRNLPDIEMLNAIANGWFEELGDAVEGTRRQVLLAVLAHITKRIETRIYKKIIENADEKQLKHLGLRGNMRELLLNSLDVGVKSDPMFIRFLAYSHLGPKPPEGIAPSTPIGTDGQPHTWAELFPHEAQYIASGIAKILANKDRWIDEIGGQEFAKYMEVLFRYFSETDPHESDRLRKEMETAYTQSIGTDFPIQIAPPTGSYYKEPYTDPELRVLLRTPETKDRETGFIKLRQLLEDRLNIIGLERFKEDMAKKTPRSYISISAYGASLTFTAAAETDEAVTLFLDEQTRHYDKELHRFLNIIEFQEDPFSEVSSRRIEEMSSEDTMLHEYSHAAYDEETPEAKRLGPSQETIIAEITAETIHRGLAEELIGSEGFGYTPEQYISVTICMPLQILEKTNDETDPYYRAAVYVLNGMFEQGLVDFDGSKIRIKNKDEIFVYLKRNVFSIRELYEDSEMNPTKAKKWIKNNTTAGEKLQKLIAFIKKAKPSQD